MHADNKEIIDGLRKGEKECIKPRAGDADFLVWEELHGLAERGILVEVEHVKAHRTKNDKKEMSHFEKFVTEGNEKADELAKAGAMLDERCIMQQEREEVYAASFHCSVEEWNDCEELRPKTKEKWIFVDQKREEMKHRTEWCAEANKFRCMRRGRGSQYMKMPGKCKGPKNLSEKIGKWRKRHEVMIW